MKNKPQAIKTAIIPIGGLGTRFLPLSRVLPKEMFPLVDIPILQYIVEEAASSGIKKIIFVISPKKKIISDYFLAKNVRKLFKNISFHWVLQKEPLGNGHAILMAEKMVKKETGVAILFGDDIIYSKKPCLLQMIKVYEKYNKPVIAICKIPKKNLNSYGVVKTKKIAKRIYNIQDITEKPKSPNASSDFAIVGKYILTTDIFNEIRKDLVKVKNMKSKKNRKEIGVTDNLQKILKNKKEICGYEFEGKWLECGNKLAYLKSNIYLSLKHQKFGPELKKVFQKDKHFSCFSPNHNNAE